ncbi:MAG TPA: protein kinase [Vicinamibacterales bacterium]|nr:protein kinase [Vicinamibacterales bacterium]
MSLTTGTRLGPFEIVAPIGAGGMGEVFRARDARLGRDVAVKVLPSLFAADADRLRRFEQEARAAAALNHPNILVVYDVGTADGVPYVVSELLEGETLRHTLERGALTPRKAIECGVQIASGLAAAHDKGIVHRDLKPENVFVTKDGRVKILDFGLAKLAEGPSNDGSMATMAHTDPGMVVGTVGYMSPEQLRGEAVDARTDVFSLGAVLYEMFCGERAFKGKTAVDTMTAILKEDPADFPPALHATAPAIERIVRRCLEKNVHERFQSARDVTFAFDALSTASGITPAENAPAAVPAPSGRSRTIAIAAAAAAVAALAAWFAGAHFGAAAPEAPKLTQLTFRSGTVRGARFGPGGQDVLYAAAWGGDPIRTYSTRPGNPESTGLPVPSADLLAVSRSSGEMALALNPHMYATFWTLGTLARASVSGGAPRPLLERVIAADFSPDGQALAAIIVDRANSSRLEFPLGTVRLSVPNPLGDVRVSPDGSQVAFVSHSGGGDDGEVDVIGKDGKRRTLAAGWLSIGGLAWANGGKELWFTATGAGTMRALRSVTLDGRQRVLYRGPAQLELQDVSPDGRALVTSGMIRSEMHVGSLHEGSDRDLSWFDWGTSLSLSRDGSLLGFMESGEGAGSKYGIFVRPTNGDPALRVADGEGEAIAPDGTQVAVYTRRTGKVSIVPTGAGTARSIDLQGADTVFNVGWFADSRRMAVIAAAADKPGRTYVVDSQTGSAVPLTPEGVAGTLVSPDGQWLLTGRPGRPKLLYNLQSKSATPFKGAELGDGNAGWTPDSKAAFVSQVSAGGIRLFRIDIATGVRTPVTTLGAAVDQSGIIQYVGGVIAEDGDHFSYAVARQLSQLFLLELPH